jgi:hypothetical protein
MKLPFIIAILTVVCFAPSRAKAQELPAVQETQVKPTKQTKITELTEAQAIEFAEKFIERNGYTDLPPDKEKLAYESIEWESNVNEMLRMRHNTLERKAFGISRGRKGDFVGWTVVFKYKNPPDKQTKKNGRAVTMNLDGSEATVVHQDFILAKVDKKL